MRALRDDVPPRHRGRKGAADRSDRTTAPSERRPRSAQRPPFDIGNDTRSFCGGDARMDRCRRGKDLHEPDRAHHRGDERHGREHGCTSMLPHWLVDSPFVPVWVRVNKATGGFGSFPSHEPARLVQLSRFVNESCFRLATRSALARQVGCAAIASRHAPRAGGRLRSSVANRAHLRGSSGSVSTGDVPRPVE